MTKIDETCSLEEDQEMNHRLNYFLNLLTVYLSKQC
jgi:hypothetical protein